MDLKKINSLTELFFFQYEKQKDKNKILLSSLRELGKNYSWKQNSSERKMLKCSNRKNIINHHNDKK